LMFLVNEYKRNTVFCTLEKRAVIRNSIVVDVLT